jgi:hypothetical protein
VPLTISAQMPNVSNMVEIHHMALVDMVLTIDQTPMGERIGSASGRLCGAVLARSMALLRNSSGVGGPTYLDDVALGLSYLNYHRRWLLDVGPDFRGQGADRRRSAMTASASAQSEISAPPRNPGVR